MRSLRSARYSSIFCIALPLLVICFGGMARVSQTAPPQEAGASSPVSPSDIRKYDAAVDRGLKALDAKITEWQDTHRNQCDGSCHHSYFPVAANRARNRTSVALKAFLRYQQARTDEAPTADYKPWYGFQAEGSKASEMTLNAWSLSAGSVLTEEDKATIRQSLLSAYALFKQNDKKTMPWLEFNLAPWEHDSGDGGLMLFAAAAYRSQSFLPKAQTPEDLYPTVDKEVARCLSEKNSLHVRVLALIAVGEGNKNQEAPFKDAIASVLPVLLQKQRRDGGWSMNDLGLSARQPSEDEISSPYATGLVLYALARVRETTQPFPDTRKALALLLKLQQADGLWYESSLKWSTYSPPSKSCLLTPMGSATAIMAVNSYAHPKRAMAR